MTTPAVLAPQMQAPSPFRIAVLADGMDEAARRSAGGLIDQLSPKWFAPEPWSVGAGRPTELMRLARRLRSERPALVYSLPSRRTDWGAVLANLLGIGVVADIRHTGAAPPGRLLRRSCRRLIVATAAQRADAIKRRGIDPDRVVVLPAEPATPRLDQARFGEIEKILIEVLQLGSSWTTTGDGELPLELPLGAGEAASIERDRIEERGAGRPNRSVRFVARPSMTVFLPPEERSSGAAIVICPGGGYAGVTIDKEGYDVARWFAARGVAGIVVKYRLPRPDLTGEGLPWPMADLDQALVLTRTHAAAWAINPDRIGVMGFSAGGHMAAWASRAAEPPAFAILVYPVISMDRRLTHAGSRNALLGKSASAAMVERYSFERDLPASLSPTFVVHARDDTVAKFDNSKAYLEALRAANIAAEALICDQGGHGFGLGIHGGDVAAWPDRCLDWIESTTGRS